MAALDVKYLRFTKATGTGSQTVTGVGFRGKALILWTTYQTTTGTVAGVELCLGMTDGTLQSTRYIHHPGNEATTTSAQAEQTDHILWRSNATSGAAPTPSLQGVFTGFTSDGFTINFTVNDGAAGIVHALVIGGSSVEASFEQVKITVNSGGTIAHTGVGFQPDAFIIMGGAADEFGSGDYNVGSPFGSMHGFGFSNASDDVCGWTLGLAGGVADCYRGQHTDRCSSVRTANLSGASELMGMTITAIGADGFTITRQAGTTTHQPVQHILCLRGVRFALGAITSPASSGEAWLDLPFQPDALVFQSHGGAASSNTSHMNLTIGAWTADGECGGTWIGGQDAANPSNYDRAHAEDVLLEGRDESTAAVDLSVSVVSVSAVGALLDYTTVPASSVQIIYMALGSTGSFRNLATGKDHTVEGADNLLAGRQNDIVGDISEAHGTLATVTADRAVLYALSGEPCSLTTPGVFKICGDLEVDGTIAGAATSLDDLDDVNAPTPADGDVLTFDSGSGEWINQASAGGNPFDQDLNTTDDVQFAHVGIGLAPDANARLVVDGQLASLTEDKGSSGTSLTINWNDGNTQLVTLTGNCTFTFSNPQDGGRYLLLLEQDGTGSRTVTWPSSVKWKAATAPVLTTTAAHVDVITFVYVAGLGASGNYLGFYNLDYTPA